MIPEFVVFTGIFMLLRTYAGGVHLNSFGTCYVCSVAVQTCGDGVPSVKKSPINQRIAPIWGKKGCVFQFPQKTHAETDLPQG